MWLMGAWDRTQNCSNTKQAPLIALDLQVSNIMTVLYLVQDVHGVSVNKTLATRGNQLALSGSHRKSTLFSSLQRKTSALSCLGRWSRETRKGEGKCF